MKMWRLPSGVQIMLIGISTILLFTNSMDFVCNGETREIQNGGAVTYEVAAKITWDETTHPQNYPADASFAPYIFVVHRKDAPFWKIGDLASPGLKLYAESGDYSTLESELQQLKDDRQIFDFYISESLDAPSGTVELLIESSFEYDHYTMLMKLEPSPDWVLGVSNLPFKRYNDIDETFIWKVNESTNLYPIDFGTDAGNDFQSMDDEEVTQQPVQQFDVNDAYPFLDPSTNTIKFIGRFTLRKI
ncbi:MAG: hypothetical protein HKN22_07965 [Bacteroidia bacterium]|nr:hypothetical protein [Bacteroidia bacterium]